MANKYIMSPGHRFKEASLEYKAFVSNRCDMDINPNISYVAMQLNSSSTHQDIEGMFPTCGARTRPVIHVD